MNNQNLHHIRVHAEMLRNSHARRLSASACAIDAIGGLLNRNIIFDDLQLTGKEVEGLTLAMQSIGEYLADFCERLEESSDFMVSKIEELEGKQ